MRMDECVDAIRPIVEWLLIPMMGYKGRGNREIVSVRVRIRSGEASVDRALRPRGMVDEAHQAGALEG